MRRRVRLVALCAALMFAALFGFLATRPVAQGATPIQSALVGTAAPRVVAQTLSGQHVALPGARTQVTVLSFFASWCGPCATEEPALEAFALNAHRARVPVAVYGVVYADSDDAIRSFMRTYGVTYPVLRDNGSTASAYGVTGPPTTVVIGRTGRIIAVLDGAVTTAQLEAATTGHGTT